MTKQTTNKAVNNDYMGVIRIPYGMAQNILSYDKRVNYTAGVYGWNSDIHHVGAYAISTGYRPTGNIKITEDVYMYDKVRIYDAKAYEIIHDLSITYDERVNKVNCLLKELVHELVKNY